MSPERQSPPRGLRQIEGLPPYTSVSEDGLEKKPLIELIAGESPYGPPKEFLEIFQNPQSLTEFYLSGMHYENAHEDNTKKTKEYVEEIFGLEPGSTEIFFSGQGSAGLLEKTLDLLPPPLKKSQLFVLGPCFPFLVSQAKVRGNRGEDIEDPKIGSVDLSQIAQDAFYEASMSKPRAARGITFPLIGLIKTELNAGADEALEIATERRLTREALRRTVLWYVCNPRTPTGDIATPAAIERFVKFTAEKGDYLLIDEAYGDYDSEENSAIKHTQDYPNLIVTRTLSKGFALPGQRIGYAVMSKEVGESFKRLNNHNPYMTSGPQQYILEKMLKPDVVRNHFEDTIVNGEVVKGVRTKTYEAKKMFVEELRKRGVHVLLTDYKTPIFTIGGSTSGFYQKLLDAGIAGAPGDGFRETHEEMSDRFVRLMIPEDKNLIPELADIIARVREEDTASVVIKE